MDLTRFRSAFPPSATESFDALELAASTESSFGVRIPADLIEFWATLGCGYYGGRDLHFFGPSGCVGYHEGFIAWNQRSFWRTFYPKPHEGGPLFFAETPLGLQLGFRLERDGAIPIVFDVNTVESFRIGDSLADAFDATLISRDALEDPHVLRRLEAHLGSLPPGHHYAPVVSPLVGGSDAPENFRVMPAVAHFVAAEAEYRAINGVP